MSFFIGDHLKELAGLMQILGLAEYFQAKLESMKDDNWEETFNMPKPCSNKSTSVAGSPIIQSCKSYAVLNSPVLIRQQRFFDTSERDKYFPSTLNVDPDDSFDEKKILVATKLQSMTLDLSSEKKSFSATRDTNNNQEEESHESIRQDRTPNLGWWKLTSKQVTDWLYGNQSHAAKEIPNSQKSRCQSEPRKRTWSRKGSNRYRASFRPKKGKSQ